MNSIFLCERESSFNSVYTEEMKRKLCESANAPFKIYKKKDVLSSPSLFRDTRFIFSTWGMPRFETEEIKECFPSLECVFYSAGSVQSFALPFIECGVKVFSAWAANAVPVAEMTSSLILLSNKGFFAHAAAMKRRDLSSCSDYKSMYWGNYNEKVGLLGVGMIGSLVAKMLSDRDIEVLAFDPFLSEQRASELGIVRCGLGEVFSECRVVSNHLANNDRTRGMLDYGCFSLMRRGATFINTGRGAQVVEEDLVRVLRERTDITAILDVTHPEPPVEKHPFYSLPNCILTPHIAGSLGCETQRMASYMEEEFCRYLRGDECKWEVSSQMLVTMA